MVAGLVGVTQAAAVPSCTPSIQVLPSVTGPDQTATAVYGLSATANMSVGASDGVPVYWKGTTVHRVPLPAGYTGGKVNAVNSFGLMVGTISGPTKPAAAFRYWYGATSVVLLPGGSTATDMNDAGHAVGYKTVNGVTTGYEWAPVATVRRTLKLAPGYSLDAVTGINNVGNIVGYGTETNDAVGEFHYAALTWGASATAASTELKPIQSYDTYNEIHVNGIDSYNRMVGTDYYSRADELSPLYWTGMSATGTSTGGFGSRTSASLLAISKTTKVAVGTASDSSLTGPFPPDSAPPVQALIWPGQGPLLALPRLSTSGATAGLAVNDDGRAAGSAVDAHGITQAVVWNCALQQATVPS